MGVVEATNGDGASQHNGCSAHVSSAVTDGRAGEKAMNMSAGKRFKKTHLTAQDCEALAEGSSSLTQPLSQSRSGGDVNRGLHPRHRTRGHRGGQGQLNITAYFRVPRTQVGAGGTQDRRIKEELLDPTFADDSFSNDSAFLEDEDFEPAPKKSSRKQPLSTAGTLKPEHDLWGEPEKKPVVVHPEHSRIKQELDDMEIEPVPDAHYGLLGTRSWEVPQGSIDMLPVEVLRNIFAFLPVIDLYQNLSLVCHRWRDIVSDPLFSILWTPVASSDASLYQRIDTGFIPWKKLYHRYLKKEATALRRVEQVMQDFAITKEQEGCVFGLIRCVSAIPTRQKVDHGAVLQCLKSHHLFSRAEVCVVNKLPRLQSRAGPESTWAIIAVMVLFSDGVSDIQKLIRCLQRPCSPLSVVDMTETLYCMATLLCAMRNKSIIITNRIHYSIFYCLYLMENASVTMHTVEEDAVASCCRQDLLSGWPDVKLTHEQQRVLNHKIERGQIVKIMAFAGSGKTSTLVKYAEKFAGLRFLYVAFNKAVAERGRSVFPGNVMCRTFHSLAYRSVGKHYKEKGKLNFSKMSAYSISFLLRNRKSQSLFVRGKMVSQTLESFFASSDEEICEEHAPHWFRNAAGLTQPVSQAEKEISVKEAKEIWHNMKKLDGDAEKKYKMTCDGYLKLWQLSKPQLSGYDAIFVDEAQDCTPAIVDIVLSQRCGIILVGDPHQQIYTFRGAVNTLYSVPHTHVYYLTQSFRFGPEIAYVGATILDVCKRMRSKTLVGGNQKGDVRGSTEGKLTLLSRSNFNVFEDAVALTGKDRPVKVHMIGGLARFGLSKIHDVWKLSQPVDERRRLNLVINDSFIKKWEETQGFIGLKEYAKHVNDKELQTKIDIVEKYRERIPELVRQIESSHVPDEARADYLIGTVHQAKGLEFDTVLLADDFVQVQAPGGNYQIRTDTIIDIYPEDEWNLLYVAVTRAKKCLLMSKSLEHLLALAGERFLRVELMSEAGKDGAAVTCSVPQCTEMLQSGCGLVVKKLPLIHSNHSRDAGGYLCRSCTQQRFGTLTPLIFSPALQEEPIQL